MKSLFKMSDYDLEDFNQLTLVEMERLKEIVSKMYELDKLNSETAYGELFRFLCGLSQTSGYVIELKIN